MKFRNRSFSSASLALLIVQLALVSAVAAKYEWQRQTSPRIWTRAFGDDPQLVLRGRYLSLQIEVDGCQSTLPSAKQALFPRDVKGAVKPGPYAIRPQPTVTFLADLEVANNALQAVYIQNEEQRPRGQWVEAWPGKSCHEMTLSDPVDFYIAGNAPGLFPLKPSQELWIEVTVPPKGPPRPTQLALKEDGNWKPLAYR